VNLWHSLLDSVGTRKDLAQAHVIILGERGAGKRSLVQSINKPFLKGAGLLQKAQEEQGSNYSSFDSSYIYIRELHEIGPNVTGVNEHEVPQNRINVWIISDPELGCMISKVLKPEDLEYTMAIIMPDLE
jgi:hypothetical protein